MLEEGAERAAEREGAVGCGVSRGGDRQNDGPLARGVAAVRRRVHTNRAYAQAQGAAATINRTQRRECCRVLHIVPFDVHAAVPDRSRATGAPLALRSAAEERAW